MKRYTLALMLSFGPVIAQAQHASAMTRQTPINHVKDAIYAHVSLRQPEFELSLPIQDESLIMPAFKAAIAENDDLREDYHRLQVSMASIDGTMTVTFHVQYLETARQAQMVSRRLHSIVNAITNGATTQVQKELAIHDYIVLHTAYDTTQTHLTPYAALTTGTTVCQGYAMMAYLMLKDAGIENHIVDGTADGQPHAWNLVRVDGRWYNLDVTWDDPVPDQKGKVSYAYFNVTDSQLSRDHAWSGLRLPHATTNFVNWLASRAKHGGVTGKPYASVLIHTHLFLETPAYTYADLTQLTLAVLHFEGKTMQFRVPASILQEGLSAVGISRSFHAQYEVDPRNPTYDIVTLSFD